MTPLREAAQQALEALEIGPDVDPIFAGETIVALRAALAQEQAKPVVPQAEPLNLSDRAVQRRLAAQWGYVPAQAEPAQEPVETRGYARKIEELIAQRDALLAEHQQTLALQQRSYEREIQLEVEAEREACANICDAHASCEGIAQQCAAAIRARGQA